MEILYLYLPSNTDSIKQLSECCYLDIPHFPNPWETDVFSSWVFFLIIFSTVMEWEVKTSDDPEAEEAHYYTVAGR